jgi:phosphoribosylformylglycinamidine cyclo-ligase
MNTSDIGACGFVYGVEMTDHIGINSVNIGAGSKDKILEQFALGFKGMIALYKKFGIKIDFFGGETADLIDPVTSIVFDVDVRSTMPKKLLIKGNVAPDDRIFGLSSAGKTPWEKEENSGIMSNGLTLGSRTLLHKDYMKKYPFLFHPNKPLKGRFDILEPIPQLDMTIGEALLSPTRQWAIIIRMLIDELQSRNALHLLHAICVNTGGGLTKCLNLGKGIRYEKTIPHPPSLFWFIQEECGETWKNMHTTFNCGIGLEIIGSDQHCVLSDALSKICRQSDVKLFSLGACSKSPSGKNEVVIHSMGKKSTYRK